MDNKLPYNLENDFLSVDCIPIKKDNLYTNRLYKFTEGLFFYNDGDLFDRQQHYFGLWYITDYYTR